MSSLISPQVTAVKFVTWRHTRLPLVGKTITGVVVHINAHFRESAKTAPFTIVV